MEILKTALKYIGIGNNPSIDVYCQTCSTELTKVGGDVSSSGRIYCHGYKDDGMSRCQDTEMSLIMQGLSKGGIVRYQNDSQVQTEIRKSRLIFYGQLEQIAQSDS